MNDLIYSLILCLAFCIIFVAKEMTPPKGAFFVNIHRLFISDLKPILVIILNHLYGQLSNFVLVLFNFGVF